MMDRRTDLYDNPRQNPLPIGVATRAAGQVGNGLSFGARTS